jgi:hypothetical protein
LQNHRKTRVSGSGNPKHNNITEAFNAVLDTSKRTSGRCNRISVDPLVHSPRSLRFAALQCFPSAGHSVLDRSFHRLPNRSRPSWIWSYSAQLLKAVTHCGHMRPDKSLSLDTGGQESVHGNELSREKLMELLDAYEVGCQILNLSPREQIRLTIKDIYIPISVHVWGLGVDT